MVWPYRGDRLDLIRKLYRLPEETARHRQMKQLCLDYFTHYEKLMKHPSKTNATRARKACVLLREWHTPEALNYLTCMPLQEMRGDQRSFPPNIEKEKQMMHKGKKHKKGSKSGRRSPMGARKKSGRRK